MASAVNAGHEARTVAEALIRHLRNGFLSLMAPDLVQLSRHQLDALFDQARRLGPARIVRGIERLGEILVELRHAPDPRVLVEVALVQLSAEPDAGADDIGALATRLPSSRRTVAAGPAAGPGSGPIDPSTGRAVLGGRARREAAPTEPAPLRDTGAAAAVADEHPSLGAPPARVGRPRTAVEQPPADAQGTGSGVVHPGRPRRGERRRARRGHPRRAQRDPPGQV